jgi:hypothetical protein
VPDSVVSQGELVLKVEAAVTKGTGFNFALA